jgi:hypothetical protein
VKDDDPDAKLLSSTPDRVTTRMTIYDQLLEVLEHKNESLKVDLVKVVNTDKYKDSNAKYEQPVVAAVQVKLFAKDFNGTGANNQDQNKKVYIQTFKVTHSTTFSQLFQAACDFWGLLEDNYELYTWDPNKKGDEALK